MKDIGDGRPVALSGAFTFATIGLFLDLALPTARAAQGAGLLLRFVMILIHAPGPPVEVLPASLARIRYSTRSSILLCCKTRGWRWLDSLDMLIVGGFLIVPALLTFVFLRRG